MSTHAVYSSDGSPGAIRCSECYYIPFRYYLTKAEVGRRIMSCSSAQFLGVASWRWNCVMELLYFSVAAKHQVRF